MLRNLVKVNTSFLTPLLRQSEQRALLGGGLCSSATRGPSPELIPLQCLNSASNQVRWYGSSGCCYSRYGTSIGIYDKMWQSVNSGMGKKGSRKNYPKGGFPGHGFNRLGLEIPGFNAPLENTPESQRKKWATEEEDDRRRGPRPKRELKFIQRRGWVGRSYLGRGIGFPVTADGEELKEFDSRVIELKRVCAMRGTGKSISHTALVMVGNRNGAIGWGIGRGKSFMPAMRKARNRAMNYLHEIPVCDGHTVYHDVKTKVNRTHLLVQRRVPGHGLRCQRIVKDIADLAGIKDIRAKIHGPTTPLTVVRCTVQALLLQESHQELAERTGKYVLEHRAGEGRPRVVGRPSPEAVAERGLRNDKMDILRPELRQHAQKSLRSVKNKYPDLEKNTYQELGLV